MYLIFRKTGKLTVQTTGKRKTLLIHRDVVALQNKLKVSMSMEF